MFNPLPASIFARDPALVARELLGQFLVRTTPNGVIVGTIVETEAYLAEGDAAAHGARPRSLRTESLYKPGGHAYVHRMRHHHLLDVVTESKHRPSAVLLRALYAVRFLSPKTGDEVEYVGDIIGPGNLCKLFGITLAEDGTILTDSRSNLYIAKGSEDIDLATIRATPRVGISMSKDLPLRFVLTHPKTLDRKNGLR